MAKSSKRGRRPIAAAAGRRFKVEKPDFGTMEFQIMQARALLGYGDRTRLEMLLTIPADRLADEGVVTLTTAKRKIITASEAVALARDELLAKARNAPFAKERRDPIGRAWYAGLLDGHGIDPTVLREAGRDYGYFYWVAYNGLNARAAHYDGIGGRAKGRTTIRKDGQAGPRFERMEAHLEPVGHAVRRALQKLCTDEIWFLEGPAWLDRLINAKRLEKGEPLNGALPSPADYTTMDLAIKGLLALANGTPLQRRLRAIAATAAAGG